MSDGNVHIDMSDTSIRVSNELADELFDRKRRGESYEDVIWRLIEQADDGGEDE
jgi:predicted CopG family antitoxin